MSIRQKLQYIQEASIWMAMEVVLAERVVA